MDQERVKYERMHRIPGYSPGPGLSHVRRFVSLLEGRHINEVLHLTVKPREWWEREIGKHWKTVESLGGSNKVFEIVGRG